MSEILFCPSSSIEDTDGAIGALPFGECEKERLRSIKNINARLESLAALSALSQLLYFKDCNKCPPKICRTESGKPFFEGDTFHFSLSHSNGLSVAVLSYTPIGIDIEFIDRTRNIDSIARRFFTEAENKFISASSDPYTSFYSLWTAKEAASKLYGTGLRDISKPISKELFFERFLVYAEGRTAVMTVCKSTCEHANIIEHYTKGGIKAELLPNI